MHIKGVLHRHTVTEEADSQLASALSNYLNIGIPALHETRVFQSCELVAAGHPVWCSATHSGKIPGFFLQFFLSLRTEAEEMLRLLELASAPQAREG